MSIRLVAIDIDGTLLDSQWQVSERNRRAVSAAVRCGAAVALVTGRRFEFAWPVVERLPDVQTIITSGGALTKTRNGRTVARRLLSRNVARSILNGTRVFREGAAVLFDRTATAQVVHQRIDWTDPRRQGYFERNRGALAEVDPLEACLTEDPIQIMFTGAVVRMRELLVTLSTLSPGQAVSVAITEYEQRGRDIAIVDVTRAGCSKGVALAELSHSLGLDRSQVMAIGDNFNDRDMLEFAGVAVVMANSVAGLHRCGWTITLSNDEDGVAAALERFVLSA